MQYIHHVKIETCTIREHLSALFPQVELLDQSLAVKVLAHAALYLVIQVSLVPPVQNA